MTNPVKSSVDVENVAGETPASNLPELKTQMVAAYFSEYTAAFQYEMAMHQARGAGYCDVIPEYTQHRDDERKHADEWLNRLEQIGIIVRSDLENIQKNAPDWTPVMTSSVPEQLKILIAAEQGAVVFYKHIVDLAREAGDEITKMIAKRHMADEEEHARDLKRILEGLA